MRQRLHRRHEDESGEIEVGNVDLTAMPLEITSNKRASVSLDRVDVLEPPGAGDLLGQDTVKLWVNAVRVDRRRDELARRDLDRAIGDLAQGVADHFRQFLRV